MFCRNCGTANPDSGQFCSKCGQPVSSAARTTPGPTPVPGSSFATPPPLPGDAHTSGKAIASLICGIFTFFLPASIAAIILGHISLSEIRNSAGRMGGRGIAITGLVLGYLGLVIIPIMIVAAIAIPNLLRARTAANEASAVGSLRSINTAAMIYAAKFENGFPSSLEVLGAGAAGDSNCNRAAILDLVLTSGRKSGYIFCTSRGKPHGQSNILRRGLHPVLEKLGIRRCGFHAFRRFRNTYLRNYTSCPNGLRKFWLGWSGEDMSDHYDKIREDAAFRREVAERVGIGFDLPKPSIVPSVGNVSSSNEDVQLVTT